MASLMDVTCAGWIQQSPRHEWGRQNSNMPKEVFGSPANTPWRFFLRWLSSWWFQPSWKILLNLDHPPQIGLKIKNVWNHLVVCVLLRFTSFPFCCSFCGKENDRMLHVYLHVPLSQCKCWWSWIVLQAKQESNCLCVPSNWDGR